MKSKVIYTGQHKTYWLHKVNNAVYSVVNTDNSPIDIATGMPASARWECENRPEFIDYIKARGV